MSKCSSHCKKEPLLIKIPEIFNNEINFRNQNFSIAISVWQKKQKQQNKKTYMTQNCRAFWKITSNDLVLSRVINDSKNQNNVG